MRSFARLLRWRASRPSSAEARSDRHDDPSVREPHGGKSVGAPPKKNGPGIGLWLPKGVCDDLEKQGQEHKNAALLIHVIDVTMIQQHIYAMSKIWCKCCFPWQSFHSMLITNKEQLSSKLTSIQKDYTKAEHTKKNPKKARVSAKTTPTRKQQSRKKPGWARFLSALVAIASPQSPPKGRKADGW